MSNSKVSKYEILKDLANGMSNQTKKANNIWLIMAVVCVWTFNSAIKYNNAGEGVQIESDLGLPTMEISIYYIFSTLMLSLLIISYSSAHIQAIRTRWNIDSLQVKVEKKVKHLKLIDLIDSIIESTFNRVGPIAQIFRENTKRFNNWPIYTGLKILASIISYIIPIVALGLSIYNSIRFFDSAKNIVVYLFSTNCGFSKRTRVYHFNIRSLNC